MISMKKVQEYTINTLGNDFSCYSIIKKMLLILSRAERAFGMTHGQEAQNLQLQVIKWTKFIP
jgi:hypothetical protein